ncbi:putative MATH/TRAF domain-containing protein [Helianthus annuus]|nr:putative MATH/TRAF domain-containing protein [Helianthus annuus]KAJ0937991.1 putative MATH/TRAF domain-containing protein [Helianthus annuus]
MAFRYLLIFPKGCDVSDHLSIFLCVADHKKLPSNTLHLFWKKEHDWGWKEYMELSRLSDGYVDYDTLVIKAQIQVIRSDDSYFLGYGDIIFFA